jgi:hypothetical protein
LRDGVLGDVVDGSFVSTVGGLASSFARGAMVAGVSYIRIAAMLGRLVTLRCPKAMGE